MPNPRNHASPPQPQISRNMVQHFVNKYEELLKHYTEGAKPVLYSVKELPKEEQEPVMRKIATNTRNAPKRQAISNPHTKNSLYNRTTKLEIGKKINLGLIYHKPTRSNNVRLLPGTRFIRVPGKNLQNQLPEGIKSHSREKSLCSAKPLQPSSKNKTIDGSISVLKYITENQHKQRINGTLHCIIDHCDDLLENASPPRKIEHYIKSSQSIVQVPNKKEHAGSVIRSCKFVFQKRNECREQAKDIEGRNRLDLINLCCQVLKEGMLEE